MQHDRESIVKSLSDITWRQFKDIVRSAHFPNDIKNMSDEQLNEGFKKFNVVPNSKELGEFREFIIKIVGKESASEHTVLEENKNYSFIDKVAAETELLDSKSKMTHLLKITKHKFQ